MFKPRLVLPFLSCIILNSDGTITKEWMKQTGCGPSPVRSGYCSRSGEEDSYSPCTWWGRTEPGWQCSSVGWWHWPPSPSGGAQRSRHRRRGLLLKKKKKKAFLERGKGLTSPTLGCSSLTLFTCISPVQQSALCYKFKPSQSNMAGPSDGLSPHPITCVPLRADANTSISPALPPVFILTSFLTPIAPLHWTTMNVLHYHSRRLHTLKVLLSATFIITTIIVFLEI